MANGELYAELFFSIVKQSMLFSGSSKNHWPPLSRRMRRPYTRWGHSLCTKSYGLWRPTSDGL